MSSIGYIFFCTFIPLQFENDPEIVHPGIPPDPEWPNADPFVESGQGEHTPTSADQLILLLHCVWMAAHLGSSWESPVPDSMRLGYPEIVLAFDG